MIETISFQVKIFSCATQNLASTYLLLSGNSILGIRKELRHSQRQRLVNSCKYKVAINFVSLRSVTNIDAVLGIS